MESVRLIYEQIEEAKRYLLGGSLLHSRLALILLDNAAELMMYRELKHEFAMYDQWEPKWEPARSEWLESGLGPKYSPDERRDADKEFAPKARILAVRLDRITADERDVICVCHKFRCEAFHGGHLRREILLPVCKLLYLTVSALTLKLRVRTYSLPGPNPDPADADFLRRFGMTEALLLVTDEALNRLHSVLIEGVVLDTGELCEILSSDMVERLEGTIGDLAYLGETQDETKIDHNLQYTQFWRQQGAELAKRRVREPDLTKAFEHWKGAGSARYTLSKIRYWQQRARRMSRLKNPAKALVEYWALDKRFSPLEEEVTLAVIEFEDDIDAQIHSLR
jgi:hypothetical protein